MTTVVSQTSSTGYLGAGQTPRGVAREKLRSTELQLFLTGPLLPSCVTKITTHKSILVAGLCYNHNLFSSSNDLFSKIV